jgi:hypothetical protein
MAEHAGSVRRREDPRLITGAGKFVDDLRVPDPAFESQIKESISSIESYRATRDTFSFVAVGKDGTSRQRVTERGLE